MRCASHRTLTALTLGTFASSLPEIDPISWPMRLREDSYDDSRNSLVLCGAAAALAAHARFLHDQRSASRRWRPRRRASRAPGSIPQRLLSTFHGGTFKTARPTPTSFSPRAPTPRLAPTLVEITMTSLDPQDAVQGQLRAGHPSTSSTAPDAAGAQFSLTRRELEPISDRHFEQGRAAAGRTVLLLCRLQSCSHGFLLASTRTRWEHDRRR